MPCEATLVSAALREANGVCFFTDATRLFGTDDGVGSCSSEACLVARSSERWLTTEVCAQAASVAAESASRSSRTTLRPVLQSTREVLALPMDNMLHPQLAPQPKPKTNTPQGSESNRGDTVAGSGRPQFRPRNSGRCGGWVTARGAEPWLEIKTPRGSLGDACLRFWLISPH